MNKETTDIVDIIETYLREVAEKKPTPEEIEFNITKLLMENELVSDEFAFEVVPLKDSYILRTRNLYTSKLLGAMPSFCKICGKLLGKSPCTHEQ
jgi:transcriptional regulator CtsR